MAALYSFRLPARVALPADWRERYSLLAALLVAASLWHLCVLASLALGFLNPLFNDATQRLGQGADFFSVYQAGHNFLDHRTIYQTAGIDRVVPYFYPFRYLPSAALLIGLPMNVLPPWGAYRLWLAVNEGLLALNLWLTWKAAPDRNLKIL